ncbi:MAG: hypothetical protein PHX60_06790 [Giesbergeria sp.]|uniref:hypothetical protein n=1 Tax=Giesbergeria sp. TaxID=2818473 RepID=UPI002603EF2F|nr:hypothetical protein [Giesbergeria sp.]MDD2609391.1 hypothetical protein [Giesbergeria sp.]
MKKIASIFIFILVLIAAKAIGNFGGKYAATSKQPSQHELLRMFVNEFAVNNVNFKYPMKINEETYLISRSIKDEGQSMFVVENYRIIAPVTASPGEIKAAEENTQQQVKSIFCASLQERDKLFTGYSSVGIIQNITDTNGKALFSVKVEKSQCS